MIRGVNSTLTDLVVVRIMRSHKVTYTFMSNSDFNYWFMLIDNPIST